MLIDEVWISAAMVPRLCAIAGAHRTTVQRWIAKRALPAAVHRLLRILDNGDLGAIHDDWIGWILDPKTGELFPPGQQRGGLTPGNLQALPWRLHQLAALKRERRATDAASAVLPTRCHADAG